MTRHGWVNVLLTTHSEHTDLGLSSTCIRVFSPVNFLSLINLLFISWREYARCIVVIGTLVYISTVCTLIITTVVQLSTMRAECTCVQLYTLTPSIAFRHPEE